MPKLVTLLAAWFAVGAMQAAPAPATMPGELSLWRLDCGEIGNAGLDAFSDTFLYPGQRKTLTDSCYLIRNGDRYLLWDTGLPGDLAGRRTVEEDGSALSLGSRIRDQLSRIRVDADRVEFVGISHYHFDHIGQAAEFPGATLLVGHGDWEAIRSREDLSASFTPWVSGGSEVKPIRGDHDVFGDGRVVLLSTPGHTPGHQSLLVRLESGPVLLTGDLYHFTENVRNHGVPSFNFNRADTLASMERFDAIARNLRARVIVQHEMDDVGKLPPFPEAAR